MSAHPLGTDIEQLGSNVSGGCIAPGLHKEVTASGAATRTLKADESGGVFLWDGAAGIAYTLPAPVVGMTFVFLVSVSVTSNAHSVVTDAATTFIGGGIQQMIDTTAVSEGQFADPTSDVTISMNGTTTGGLIGTRVVFECISSTVWNCSGLVASSGTLATPFA